MARLATQIGAGHWGKAVIDIAWAMESSVKGDPTSNAIHLAA